MSTNENNKENTMYNQPLSKSTTLTLDDIRMYPAIHDLGDAGEYALDTAMRLQGDLDADRVQADDDLTIADYLNTLV